MGALGVECEFITAGPRTKLWRGSEQAKLGNSAKND
jgi:hypothetical protein